MKHSIISFQRTGFAGKTNVVMFCLGADAMLVQLLMTRELMVAFYGNELAVGIIFTVWLLMVSAGSLVIRPRLGRLNEAGLQFLLTILLGAAAVLPPCLIFGARALRIFFSVPMGEYMGFGQILAGAFLALAPVCVIVGMAFPAACRLAVSGDDGVSGVYAAESAGGMAAGVVFSFLLVNLLSPLETAVVAALVVIFGAALIAPRVSIRRTCRLIALGLAALIVFPGPVQKLETAGIKLRWQAFGVLPRGGVRFLTGNPRLLDSKDSRYQNLALVELEGQKTLYGNGQMMFAFPDAISAEQKIHFIMAQKPDAKKVLLIGGNPVSDIPELLKYHLTSLTHVELDACIDRMLFDTGGDVYRRALADPRLKQRFVDAPRYVKMSRERFDVVIVEAPDPTTVALNRFYTVEFFRDASRRLTPGGFLYTAVNASENLQDEAAGLAASVYQALKAVFPRLLVTAGSRNQFFAGNKDAPVTFDGQALFERWSGAGVKTEYFRPEYFLNADEISSDKTDFVRRRLAGVSVPVNSDLRPVSAFYNLTLWSRYSGSRLHWFFNVARHLRIEWALGAVAAVFGLLLLYVIALFRSKNVCAFERSQRLVVAAVIAATGFAGLALELVLIFIFQARLGYIYASIGLLVAMFMLGLALGALAVRNRAGWDQYWKLFLGLDAVLLLIALVLPFLMKHDGGYSTLALVAGSVYFLTLLTGWAGGAQFILANKLLNSTRTPDIARNAALLNAVDLAGAALGGISVGVVLLPLFGIGGTCGLLAALKTGTLALIGAFLLRQFQKHRSRQK